MNDSDTAKEHFDNIATNAALMLKQNLHDINAQIKFIKQAVDAGDLKSAQDRAVTLVAILKEVA